MSLMTLRITNATFESSSDEGDYATVEEGYAAAVAAGLRIAADEVAAGALASVVEVAVDVPGQRYAARGAVSVATARLLSRNSADEVFESIA